MYGKLKIMVVVTNSGEQYYMTKTEYFVRNTAVKKLIEITNGRQYEVPHIWSNVELL